MTSQGQFRSRRTLAVIGTIALLGALGFAALGVWQLERLSWKTALIAAVDTRIHADPVDAGAPAFWASFDPDTAEYQHASVTGHFDTTHETLVQAVTAYGAGFWVLTPLVSGAGTVLVNRGFVPPERRDPATHPAPEGEVTITGLLRLTEPDGAFLRGNDPADERWYSRDVTAIAAAKNLGPTAPFFLDAERGPDPTAYPIGGLTVLSFSNNHLVYALTWFALSAMLISAFGYVLWDRRGRRDRSTPT
ncbi:SURF1-like protein [Devosia yakushimensis]|uniref:SURF1-like protein n=1 Tax=Devosia yakushimensis TaxID=470028 RepID=A0ABQ5UGN2_9HYPH|nr:SURF1 family protein [Devosia yakushimensis]GLQ11224.1 SURF1-like protein [Devosia yakushimensis]